MIIGIVGLLGGPPSPTSVVFTIGGLALLITAVIRYRRASRNGRGSASEG